MGSEIGGGVPESATIANTLGALKQEGSNILLVGTGASTGHRSACRRLLGESSRGPRYRIFVRNENARCSHGPAASEQSEYGHGSDDATRVIVRSDDPDRYDDSGEGPAVVGTDLLSLLGIEVIETVSELDDAAGELEPSELRLCVDSLGPLLSDHRPENVFRLLHVVTSRVRQVRGMGHFHLPLGVDHDAVNLLEPLFDAIVEVRTDDGGAEQRWHLREKRTTSDWHPV